MNYHGLCAITSFLEYLKRPPDLRRKTLPLHLLKGCSTVFYNRIPETGSRVLHTAMSVLGGRYNYTVTSEAKGLVDDTKEPAKKVVSRPSSSFSKYIDEQLSECHCNVVGTYVYLW